MNSKTIIFILCLLAFCDASKQICKKITNCKCQHSKGIVDLSSISKQEFSVTKGNQLFRYFPCNQTESMGGDCEKSGDNAVCVQDKKTGQVQDWGSEMSVSFIVPNPVDYSVIIAKFESSDSKRKTEIYLACPKKDGGPGLEVLEVQGDNVELRLTSNAACYTQPSPPITTSPIHTLKTTPFPIHTKTTRIPIHTNSHKTPLTPTSGILTINLRHLGHWYLLAGSSSLVLLCLIGYVLVGVVSKFRNKASGKSGDPSQRVSCSLCGLFIDGILFVFSCFPFCRHAIGRGSRGGYEPIGIEDGYTRDVNNLNSQRCYNNNVNNNNDQPPKKSCSIW